MRRNKKSLVITVMCLMMVSIVLSPITGLTAFAAKNEGSCGKDIKWSYSAGTLTIKGKGAMKDYNEVELAPWKSFASEIKAIRISDGITSIGSLAFYDCNTVAAVEIPDSVEKINEKAFLNCTGLRFVDLSDNLKFVGRSAFYNCEKLETLQLPNTLETISDKAFYLCRSVKILIIPESVKKIGEQAFGYCKGLIRVEINAKITEIPEWCFYGCESLTQIKLPETVTEIGTYAFKNCDSLYTVSYSGNKNETNSIRNQISEDVPSLKTSGHVSSEELEEETLATEIETDKNGNFVSQTNTTVRETDKISLVTTVTLTKQKDSVNSCSVYFVLTVDGDDAWGEAISIVTAELAKISSDFSLNGKFSEIRLTLFMKNTNSANQYFLKEMQRRGIIVEVVSSNGSVWGVDFGTNDSGEIEDDVDFSYTVTEAPQKTEDKLGVEYSYEVDFNNSSSLNTNVVIALPDNVANTNAFLYKQNLFGKLTKIQATMVDSQGNAHFYLSSVDKNAKYIIGINVPGEDTKDVIIPDESKDVFGAIARLEKIDYASAGPRKMFGLTITQLVLIVLGILLVIGIVVGIIMFQFNKIKPYANRARKAR